MIRPAQAALPLLATFCLSSLLAQQTPAPNATDIRKQIEAEEAEIARGLRTHDLSALEKYWSPQMIVNAPENSIRTRADVISAMQRGGLNYTSLKGTTESFRVFGEIAVEMGHEEFVMAAGPSAGKPLQRRFTNIWQRSGDYWVQIARQATILDVSATSVYGPT